VFIGCSGIAERKRHSQPLVFWFAGRKIIKGWKENE